ncbi:MAG: sugar ABC transporter ATP-binding protein [Planctomycetes bacterium]|nr:sugar ABC transporter ATP-binding protein [Planctomycetota bacterium]
MPDGRLETEGLRKDYPGTVALDGVSVAFEAGKVSALIGKNGAGKSTLVKILAGAVRPTSGSVRLNGRTLQLRSPREALAQGIAAVHQELSLIPDLTVGENILLGRLPKRGHLNLFVAPASRRWVHGRDARATTNDTDGHRRDARATGLIIDWKGAFDRAAAILSELGLSLDVRAKVSRLSIAQQQIVEIAKAMSYAPRVLMLDEPTSALAANEVDRLFELIRSLARRGVILVYISHRLHELSRIADSVTALRDGRVSGTMPIGEATPKAIVQLMFGDDVAAGRPGAAPSGRATVLEVRGLSYRDILKDISLALMEGEILGIAGMLGSGRTELLMSIFGAMRASGGEILVDGRVVRRPTPGRMKRLGLGLAPESRKTQGIVPLMSIRDNGCLAGLAKIAKHGVIWKARQRRVVEGNVRELQIRTPGIERAITSLSGGNQQKVVIGNWLNTRPRVMMFDEPTRGIDVQAKGQIFDIIRGLSRQGIACLFVSSELEELLEVCHRVIILRDGRIAETHSTEGLSLQRLFEGCMGA